MVQIHSGLPSTWSYGALAQLGEHLLCKQGVIGSIPIGSTRYSIRWMKRKRISRLTRVGGFEPLSLTL